MNIQRSQTPSGDATNQPIKTQVFIHGTQIILDETNPHPSSKKSDSLQSLLDCIPKDESFDEYLPYCKFIVKARIKYMQIKKWMQDSLVGKTSPQTTDSSTTAPLTSSNSLNPVEIKKHAYQKQFSKLKETYAYILSTTFQEYSLYGLLTYRASQDLYASKALVLWTRIRFDAEQGLETLHNKLISKLATLPPTIIKKISPPNLIHQIGSYDSFEEIDKHIRLVKNELDDILKKYIEATSFEITEEDLEKAKCLRNLVKKKFAGGLYTTEEMLQFPLTKINKVIFDANDDYKTLTSAYSQLTLHIQETEKFLSEIIA